MGAVLSKYFCCFCTDEKLCYPCKKNKKIDPECKIYVEECFLEITNI